MTPQDTETLVRPEDTPPKDPSRTAVKGAPPERWRKTNVLALVLVTFVALFSRVLFLSDPSSLVFDETYYARDACFYVASDAETCYTEDEITGVHPPLGKWLISIGMTFTEYRCVEDTAEACRDAGAEYTPSSAFGWRIIPALAGTLTVALLYLLAWRLFRSRLAAAITALLLAIDPLHFVQSRIAMLDIFLPLFGIAAVLFIHLDKDRLVAHRDSGATELRGGWIRPWRIAAGVCVGLAIATKWSGGLLLLLILFLSFAWEVAARRSAGRRAAFVQTLRYQSGPLLVWLVLLPAIVYLTTYIGRLEGGPVLALPWAEESWWRSLFERHHYMYFFHKNLDASHSYQSPAWSWLLLKRPVSYFFCSGASCTPPAPEGDYQEVFATGSPLVWWTSLLALIYVTVAWIRKRDFRGPEGLIVAGFFLTYVPWLILPSERSAVFLFYLLPTIPFMCLALGYVVTRIGRSWEAKAAISVFLLGAVWVFAFYYPLLTKRSIPESSWRARIWIFNKCDKPPGETVTSTIVVTEDRETKETTTETTEEADGPPEGWCWI
ncbi:MAG: phospholipid carrier-dependent glycosyltransferase [Actinomycetota bacterium]